MSSEQTVELIRELGCDMVQGDCIQKPMHPALVRFEPVSITNVWPIRSGQQAGADPAGAPRRRHGIQLAKSASGGAGPLAPEV